jgi:hypothetical protein
VVVPVEGIVVLAVVIAVFVLFDLVALRFGRDSRDLLTTRWAIRS